jgi:hypothetical protein
VPLWGTAPHNLGPFLRPSSCWCWCFETGAYGRRLARRAPLLNRRRPVASHRGLRSPQRGASRHRVRRRGRGLRRRVRHLPGRRRADAVPPPTRMELLPGHVPPSARALLRAHGLAVALPSAPQAHLQAIVSAPAWWMNAQSPPTYGHLSGRSGQGGETQHPQLIPRRALAPPSARDNLAAVARALRRPCRARCEYDLGLLYVQAVPSVSSVWCTHDTNDPVPPGGVDRRSDCPKSPPMRGGTGPTDPVRRRGCDPQDVRGLEAG